MKSFDCDCCYCCFGYFVVCCCCCCCCYYSVFCCCESPRRVTWQTSPGLPFCCCHCSCCPRNWNFVFVLRKDRGERKAVGQLWKGSQIHRSSVSHSRLSIRETERMRRGSRVFGSFLHCCQCYYCDVASWSQLPSQFVMVT